MKWKEEKKEIKPKENSQEERMRVGNEKKLRNKAENPVKNRQSGEIPTISPTNNTLQKIGEITDTKWSKAPVGQRSLSPRENKEQRQEAPSSSPLEKDKAVQVAVSAKAKRADKQIENEILDESEKEKQNKLKLKREENEEIGKIIGDRARKNKTNKVERIQKQRKDKRE